MLHLQVAPVNQMILLTVIYRQNVNLVLVTVVAARVREVTVV